MQCTCCNTVNINMHEVERVRKASSRAAWFCTCERKPYFVRPLEIPALASQGSAGGELSVARVSEIILPSSEKGRARWAATLIVLQPGIARPGLFCSPVIHLLWGKGTKAWNVLTQIFVSSLSHEKCLLFCIIILVREMRGSLLLSALRKDKLSVDFIIISDLNSKKGGQPPSAIWKIWLPRVSVSPSCNYDVISVIVKLFTSWEYTVTLGMDTPTVPGLNS